MTTQLTEMNGIQLLSHYNNLVNQADSEGLTGFRQLRVFHDKPTAIKRCEAMESSLRAWREGQRAEDRREAGGICVVASVEAQEKMLDVPPGRGRLLASGHADTLRQQTLADQERAAQLAAAPETTPASTKRTQKVAKAKKEKSEKTEGSRRGRASAFADDAKITLAVEGNPKREGARSFDVFKLYRSGMLVSTFIEKVGDRGEAHENLRYDTKKGYVMVG